MTQKLTKYVWALTRLPPDSRNVEWLGVFSEKPDLRTIAPYLAGYLASNMGTAIAQACELLDTGAVTLYNHVFGLDRIPLDQPL
jgi:hypothetical protein